MTFIIVFLIQHLCGINVDVLIIRGNFVFFAGHDQFSEKPSKELFVGNRDDGDKRN